MAAVAPGHGGEGGDDGMFSVLLHVAELHLTDFLAKDASDIVLAVPCALAGNPAARSWPDQR